MVHFLCNPTNFTKLSNRCPGFACSPFAMSGMVGKYDWRFCEAHFRPHPSQSEKAEDMRNQHHISPITDPFADLHLGPVVRADAVAHVRRCHRCIGGENLSEKPAIELQQSTSNRG